jgi:putative membrane-bound dehydrogenase-like protein
MRLATLALLLCASPTFAADPPKLKVLFLGDNAGHAPATRFKLLQPVLAARGIELTYTDKVDDLNAANLDKYDGLAIYANHTKITADQEKALLDYVAAGKGFIPIHCASYCFLNSDEYVKLVGAQFRTHGTGTFRTEITKPDHPIMKGFSSFSSWDETYVHTKHNEKDRTVLEVRAEGDLKEPWTWVRRQGKGRVFYTAWGHDQRTWTHEGFQNLIERGIRWACGQDPAIAGPYFDRPEMTKLAKDVKPFEYVEAKIPFYAPPGTPRTGNLSKMQKPLPVDESMKHMSVPVDFAVKIFVTEEKLGGKPICMNWDEQGRLWVALTIDYPNELKPEGQGRDRIVVCEDEDGDGVCDKVTTFADKLSIPTSLLPYAGGIIVHQAPHTLFLKDTDGDGKADLRQILFTGWNTGDTHAGPSNLHYGFDNWIYGSVGYAGFDGTVAGEAIRMRQGFYRFKIENANPLKVTKLEFLRSTSNNTWGLCFDEAGQLFGSTANGCPLVHMPIPNRYYEKVKGLTPTVLQNIAADNHMEPITEKIRQVDFHGGFTAASNCSIYTARTYPKEYWNRVAFVSEPTGHLTAAFTLKPDGATFKARMGWNLLASDDEWVAPIDAQVGPDGHMWVIDWYNFIVQHNPQPAGFTTGKGNAYETPLRDKTHGRIYRVVYTKAKPEPRLNLKDASAEKLVETLKHHNLTWRLHAQRLLVERGKADVAEQLAKLIINESVDETGLNPGAVHALWTLGSLDAAFLETLNLKLFDEIKTPLKHPSAAVRQAACEVMPTNRKATEFFHGVVSDINPQVRLRAYLALSRFAKGTALPAYAAVVAAKTSREDRAANDALTIAAIADPKEFLLHCFVIQEQPTPEGVRIMALVSQDFAGKAERGDLEFLIGAMNLSKCHGDVLDSVVGGLMKGGLARGKLDFTNFGEEQTGLLIKRLGPASRANFIKLASTWGVKGLDAQLAELTKAAFATVADAKAADADRIEAAKQIVEFQPDSDEAAAKLLEAITPEASAALAGGIVDALAESRAKSLGSAAVAKLKDLPPTVRPAALRIVLAKPDSIRAFLDAVEKGTFRFDLLALDQRNALASHPDKSLAERARRLLALGGGLPNADRQKVIEELKPILAKTGDADNGKKMMTQHCAKCHQHSGEGTAIGPDLTGMAVHPKEELLIHIIDPSRSVEGNFKAYRVVTVDDRTIIGILGATTGTSVEIIDGEAKRHALAKDDIASLKETDKSLMPEGFEKVMKPEELGDLLEFLTQKGKFVPLPLDKIATVVSTKDMFFDAGGQAERLIFPDWKPKTFKGVPFVLVDPQGEKVKNLVMLNGPNGKVPPTMPRSVSLPFNGKAKSIHLLSGVGGWNSQQPRNGPVSMIVRLTYEDGKTEDHELRDGVHFADYIGKFNVPGSEFAFALRGQQIRYLKVDPKRPEASVKTIEFVKGTDRSAPVVMAVTVETP